MNSYQILTTFGLVTV